MQQDTSNSQDQQPIDPFTRRDSYFSDPGSWYDAFYKRAGGDAGKIPWARMAIRPALADWLTQHEPGVPGQPALVVGCGLGDDAEALAQRGLQVTAFDVSPRAIDWCRQRFPNSPVNYQVADLFQPPHAWRHAFDFVFESLTIQSLPPDRHLPAISHIADFVAAGGTLLVICHGRDAGELLNGPPWPLAKTELDAFQQHGLTEIAFKEQVDSAVKRFVVEYRK